MSLVEISLAEFLADFEPLEDNYCFILGAGASKQSKIPTGQEMVETWIHDLRKRDPAFSYADISPDMSEENRYEFYAQVYAYRFRQDYRKGYRFLQRALKNGAPGFGHSVLAHMMAHTKQRLVITTNFDTLVEDALSQYTRAKPLIIEHEALAGFLDTGSERPTVAKLHRGLLLEPFNDTKETATLHESWRKALNRVFLSRTPLFFGYGGNDGSLMGYLEEIEPLRCLYWFYYRPDRPGARIRALVDRHNGCLVPIDGFNEAMFQFCLPCGYHYDGIHAAIVAKNEERLKAFETEWKKLSNSLVSTAAPDALPSFGMQQVDTTHLLSVRDIAQVGPINASKQDWLRWLEDAEDTDKRSQLLNLVPNHYRGSTEFIRRYGDAHKVRLDKSES